MFAGVLAFGAPPAFTLAEDPIELVRDSDRFTRFAQQVAVRADELMKVPDSDSATRKLLLGLRVHLALHLHEDELALALAEQIRAGQTDSGERAHSGLTTRALVTSRRHPAGFESEFTRLLRELPRDASTRAALVRARQKIEQMSEESLLAEIRKNIAPRLARGEPCTLEVADEIVRAGHRLRTILPVRSAMLRAYADAIAAQDR